MILLPNGMRLAKSLGFTGLGTILGRFENQNPSLNQALGRFDPKSSAFHSLPQPNPVPSPTVTYRRLPTANEAKIAFFQKLRFRSPEQNGVKRTKTELIVPGHFAFYTLHSALNDPCPVENFAWFAFFRGLKCFFSVPSCKVRRKLASLNLTSGGLESQIRKSLH